MKRNLQRRFEALNRQSDVIFEMPVEKNSDFALRTLAEKAFCENMVETLVLAGVPMERIVTAITHYALTGEIDSSTNAEIVRIVKENMQS